MEHFLLGEMLVWSDAARSSLNAEALFIHRLGEGPFKMVGLRLNREEPASNCPVVAIELSDGTVKEFGEDWFKRAKPEPRISCKIEQHEIALDPPINVLHVELSKGDGCWPETFPDESHLKAFLRGVSAGASLSGGRTFFPPELPSSTKATFVLKEISKEGLSEYDPSDGGGLFSSTRHEEGGGFFSRG
jgi:hypothetical protein